MREIQEQTCASFGVTMDELLSASRAQPVAWPRQVAMYLSRELTDATLPAIGRAFNKNHTTVMHACRRTAERMAADREAYEAVQRLTNELGGALSRPMRLTDFDSSRTALRRAQPGLARLLHRMNSPDDY